MAHQESQLDPTDGDEFSADEFEALRQDLASVVHQYREEVLETIEPSPDYRASMHKMMLGLVRDDVLEAHRKSSWLTRLSARGQRWLACWRELGDTSLSFRLATQAVFALGIGLLLSMAWISAMDKEPLAARMSSESHHDDLVPNSVWTTRSTDKEALPPAPLGDLPKIAPAKPMDKTKRR